MDNKTTTSAALAGQGLAGINELVIALYRHGREMPLPRFQAWALERLREAVEFDSALWRAGGDTPPLADSVFLVNQPRSLLEDYLGGRWHQQDFLRRACAAQPGRTFAYTDLVDMEAFRASALYRKLSQRYGLEWALSTHHIDPNSSLKSVITLWRADRARPFSEVDRARKELLVPHLVEAMHANRLWHFANARQGGRGAGRAMAVCDHAGWLHDSSRGFFLALRAEWPDWNGPALPPALVGQLGSGRFVGRRIDVDATPLSDQWLLTAFVGGAVKQLGKRELQVARLYAGGLTYRAIAAKLGVAPATVRNQLRAGFAKLGVSSKVELARRLGEIDSPD